MTAQNLLYIESSGTMFAGAKGTKEYDEIMKKLQEHNYKHQQQQDEQDRQAEEKIKALQERVEKEIVAENNVALEKKEIEAANS
jgi:hypothetical protein